MALLTHEHIGVQRSNVTFDTQPATTTGTAVTASTTIHTFTGVSPTEIVAATAYEADWIEVQIHNISVSATLKNNLVNIYIGGAGTETLLIDSIHASMAPTIAAVGLPLTYWFPLRIPRGTRISAMIRSDTASQACRVIVLYGKGTGHWSGSGVETLGEVTASSRGTVVTQNTAAPAWATIGTSTRNYQYIVIGTGGNSDATALDGWLSWTVGTGSAMLQNLGFIQSRTDATEANEIVRAGRWCDIPSGTALQLRAWVNAAAGGTTYATIMGVY